MSLAMHPAPADRLAIIGQARHAVMVEGRGNGGLVDSWIERSWQRCLTAGRAPGDRVTFDAVTASTTRRAADESRPLVQAALPVLEKLARAIANTHYFAILTDAQGVVVHSHGAIDRSDRRATTIARVGVDLSERAVGTTAIGAALAELAPVQLHRGEHFHDDTSVYSCAGAPLFGPAGQCVGMLDLTGVEVPERPELKHLVAQSARSIEDALVIATPHALLLRVNWPGRSLGEDSDGLLALDTEGYVVASNVVARQVLAQPVMRGATRLHASDLFAMPWEMFFDSAARNAGSHDVPLWSGLRLQVLARHQGAHMRSMPAAIASAAPAPLREVEASLIRRAVDDARGNVAEAARALGISRATVYRKLGRPDRS